MKYNLFVITFTHTLYPSICPEIHLNFLEITGSLCLDQFKNLL